MSDTIEGVKLIYQTGVCDNPDDPSYPWKLEANFRPPEFMNFAFVCLYGGSEEIIVRGKTKEALEQFAKLNNLYNHPRLRALNIYQP